ncbi:hypothetical protein D9M73_92050 [compost metagenome]
MRLTRRATSSFPLDSMAGTTKGACACRPSISRMRPTASARATPNWTRSRCSIKSVCAKAAPAVLNGPSAQTMRSASTMQSGSTRCNSAASHQDVVTLRPGSRPAACSKKTAEQDAATRPPRAACVATARTNRCASALAKPWMIAPGLSRPRPGIIHVPASGPCRLGRALVSTCMPELSGTEPPDADNTRQVGRASFRRGASADAACRTSSVAATLLA